MTEENQGKTPPSQLPFAEIAPEAPSPTFVTSAFYRSENERVKKLARTMRDRGTYKWPQVEDYMGEAWRLKKWVTLGYGSDGEMLKDFGISASIRSQLKNARIIAEELDPAGVKDCLVNGTPMAAGYTIYYKLHQLRSQFAKANRSDGQELMAPFIAKLAAGNLTQDELDSFRREQFPAKAKPRTPALSANEAEKLRAENEALHNKVAEFEAEQAKKRGPGRPPKMAEPSTPSNQD